MTIPPFTALGPNAVIGIVGGGQLGRMSAMAAAKLGFRTHILTQAPNSPAAQVAHGVTLGAYDDLKVLEHFARAVDVVTFEFENISADGLDCLAQHCPVRPSGAILRISQERTAEKTFLTEAGIPIAPWHSVTDEASLEAAAEKLGVPFILKTARDGYDGKGQRRIYRPEDMADAYNALTPRQLVAESMVDFASEISIMVVRGQDGTVQCFDPAQNFHHHGILDITLAPAPIPPELALQAQAIATTIAHKLELVGLLGVEMFIDRTGALLVNEIAPRPHNSGHWTMDACPVDQFDMHIRAVAGLPLPQATRHSDAVMKNLVGPDDMALWPTIVATPELLPHLYGKAEARHGRKMGHVNRLFPYGSLPGALGIQDALGPLSTVADAAEPADE